MRVYANNQISQKTHIQTFFFLLNFRKTGLQRPGSSSSYITPRNIKYNFSNSKYSVSIPRYFYNGGPTQIKNLLATCWRLHYLKCPGKNWQLATLTVSNGAEDTNSKNHPCCKLISQPMKGSFPSHRISRWLS